MSKVSQLVLLGCTLLLKTSGVIGNDKLDINGYISTLPSINWNKDTLLLQGIVHNRININWYPTSSISGSLQFRNLSYGGTICFPACAPDLEAGRACSPRDSLRRARLLWTARYSFLCPRWLACPLPARQYTTAHHRSGSWRLRNDHLLRHCWKISTHWQPLMSSAVLCPGHLRLSRKLQFFRFLRRGLPRASLYWPLPIPIILAPRKSNFRD